MTRSPLNVLEIRDLRLIRGGAEVVRGVDLTVPAGGRVGIVGESGAGKSITALAVMGLLAKGWSSTGQVVHDGTDLLTLSERALARLRGRTISMVFQDPLSSLDPTKRVGRQITSVIRRHTGAKLADAKSTALQLLESLRLPRPTSLMRAYPHELSGGQQQRITVAMALVCNPKLLIADEPTTALDVTVQKDVLRLIDIAIRERGTALLMITHDLPVIAALCDQVFVMYAGRVIESGSVVEVFTTPRHPYTAALLRAQPVMDNISMERTSPLVSIPGTMPPAGRVPVGCAFRPRCTRATDACFEQPPVNGKGHSFECWNPLEVNGT